MLNPPPPPPSTPELVDTLRRPLRDLRISVTDRCNFRCPYCMPKHVFGPDHVFMQRPQLLTFEEIERVARVAAGLGVTKLRLTGGEPLLRRQIDKLVRMLARVPGIQDLTLTTNGAALTPELAHALKAAGLQRITISLDALDDATFGAMNDAGFTVARVLKAIEAAANAGLLPVKVNMVVQRSVNAHSIVPMARHFRGSGHILRYIEYMDVGTTNGWKLAEVVPAAEIVRLLDAEFGVEPAVRNYTGEVAERWRYRDGSGEVGIISSVTQPFCGACTRARISADGRLYTCLFAAEGHDLRTLLRDGADDARIRRELAQIWAHRADRYSEIRSGETIPPHKVEMSFIGG